MKQNAHLFNWNHARAFLATAKTGSLSKAAQELHQSQPTIGRQIAALESDLGVLLFDRVGQRLVLTSKGAQLLERVEAMQKAATDISLLAQSNAASTKGHVSISVSDNFALHFAPQIVARAREVAPNITLDIRAENSVEDITRREADIAIRHIAPEPGDLIAKSLGPTTARLYAHKSYLDTMGRPQKIEDLGDMELIAFGEILDHLERARAYGVKVLPNFVRYGSNSGIVAWELVKSGFGAMYMADLIARSCPDIEAILPHESQIEFPNWIVTHRELHTNKRIRMIFDLIVELFRNQQSQNTHFL